MKINKRLLGLMAIGCLMPIMLSACVSETSSTSIEAVQQEKTVRQATVGIGLPNIINFTEKRLAKKIYELRDEKITTFTYLFSEQTGKKIFLCKSIGYGLPYATQYSNPEKIISFHGYKYSGDSPQTMPQAEPNGLYMPSSADGTWVNCINKSGSSEPIYVEPKLIVSPFKLGE